MGRARVPEQRSPVGRPGGRVYGMFFRVVLSRIPAETAHHLAFGAIRVVGAVPGLRWVMRRVLGPRGDVAVEAFGRKFPGPLGLAAGFDKDARGIGALAALGFGFVEVGTITAEPQPGNDRPRLFRLPADRALVNRMGFNNAGADAVAGRLRRRRRSGVLVGINIGKTKVVPETEAVEDYVRSTRALAPYADYLVVNVSSPNTPGLRDLQAVEKLRPLLVAVREAAGKVPLLVKIAPDLADADVDAVADLAVELGLDGIVATNTTIGREQLATDQATVAAVGAGGLSGAPLADRSLHVLRRLSASVGDRLVLISAGGIETADDVWERLRAGATLVQGYTGFIYGGPLWPRRIHRELARGGGGEGNRLADAFRCARNDER